MRNIINFNATWKFSKDLSEAPAVFPEGLETVDLPHTWNAIDDNSFYDRCSAEPEEVSG